jgi:ribosomal protein S18 acetylase RimI-like enzyme
VAHETLADAIRIALTTSHNHLAKRRGLALRYPEQVAPFAALEEQTPEALEDLRSLMEPGQTVFTLGQRPIDIDGLEWSGTVQCFQMIFPLEAAAPQLTPDLPPISALSCTDSPAMLALIAATFPGYFREGTCNMGSYFGMWDGENLIAMVGERLVLDPLREISALCTHPAHTGLGLGTALLGHMIRHHRKMGALPWLHVTTQNTRAIGLYHHLGFETVREVTLHRMVRHGTHS